MVKKNESLSVDIGVELKSEFDLLQDYKNLGKSGRDKINQSDILKPIIKKYIDDFKANDDKFVEYINFIKGHQK